jgi:prepilin-type N-terminal cleavage/methylation domain-containing protein
MSRHASSQSRSQPQQAGFTILELLIATTVLSVILVMVTVVMVGIGRLYYKGINQARVQDNVRSIVDELARQVQLYDQPPMPDTTGNVRAYCFGATRYIYVVGQRLGTEAGQSPQVLWRDTTTPGSCNADDATFSAPLPQGTELIGPRSRLTAFDITCPAVTKHCVITVGVAYGDDNQLTSPAGINARCQDTEGRQFCAAANLTTTVVRRLN